MPLTRERFAPWSAARAPAPLTRLAPASLRPPPPCSLTTPRHACPSPLQIQDGQMHGKGSLIYPNGERYEGSWCVGAAADVANNLAA